MAKSELAIAEELFALEGLLPAFEGLVMGRGPASALGGGMLAMRLYASWTAAVESLSAMKR